MYNVKLASFKQTRILAEDLTSASVQGTFIAMSKLIVKRLAIVISTATVSTGNIVITARKRPTVGSSASQTSLPLIKVPTATAAGSVIYVDLSSAPATFQPGEELAFEVTTAAAGGGAAGAGFCFPEEDEESPEVVANYTNHTVTT